jgi:hypothetical protein
MGGFVGVEEDIPIGERKGDGKTVDPTPLTAVNIEKLRRTVSRLQDKSILKDVTKSRSATKTITERLPDLTTAEIQDKSKGNLFVKTVAIIQVFCVVLQIIVVAFSACFIITYILLIPKPQGVRVPTRPIICEAGSLDEAKSGESLTDLRLFVAPGSASVAGNLSLKRIPNDCIISYSDSDAAVFGIYGIIIGAMVFGSIHVAGWNFAFPTPVEQRLWQIGNILLTVLIPL